MDSITTLFGPNILVIFIITVIVISSYTNFEENQQVSILYLLIYGIALFKLTRIWQCIILLFISTFVLIEFLTREKKKLELITRFSYKILDYLFQLFFQLHVVLLLLSLLSIFVSHFCNDTNRYICLSISALFFVICEHRVITQPFKVKSITETIAPFNEYPYYNYEYSKEKREKYDLVCSIEDKTYFKREKSYSTFSYEYFKMRFSKKIALNVFKKFLSSNLDKESNSYIGNVISRGYSTPEMQLIRTAGVKRGYDKYKYQRKIYEIIYSKIILSSLYTFQLYNSGTDLSFFRSYVFDVYLHTVLSKVDKARFYPLCSAFEDKDVESWPLEALFVLCLGLSFKLVNEETIKLYQKVILQYGLNIEKIKEYNEILSNGDTIPSTNSIIVVEH